MNEQPTHPNYIEILSLKDREIAQLHTLAKQQAEAIEALKSSSAATNERLNLTLEQINQQLHENAALITAMEQRTKSYYQAQFLQTEGMLSRLEYIFKSRLARWPVIASTWVRRPPVESTAEAAAKTESKPDEQV